MKIRFGRLCIVCFLCLCLAVGVSAEDDDPASQTAPAVESASEAPAREPETASGSAESHKSDRPKTPETEEASDPAQPATLLQETPSEDGAPASAQSEMTEPTAVIESLSVRVAQGHTALFPGERVRLQAVIHPRNADASAIRWRTLNPALAQVSKDGLVTVPASANAGEAGSQVDIWAEATDGSYRTALITLTVLPKATSLSIRGGNRTVRQDSPEKPVSLEVSVTPAVLGRLARFRWQSSNPRVVDVRGNGQSCELIWGAATGEATVRVSLEDGTARSASMRLRVVLLPDGLTLDAPQTLQAGETAQLRARLTRSDGCAPSETAVSYRVDGGKDLVSIDGEGRLRVGAIPEPMLVHVVAVLDADPSVRDERVVLITP